MKRCPNCGSYDVVLKDGKYVCKVCGESYHEAVITELNRKHINSINLITELVERDWISLRQQIADSNQKISAYEQEINDLRNQLDEVNDILRNKDKISVDDLKSILEKLPGLATMGCQNTTSSDDLTNAVSKLIEAKFNELSERIINNMKVKQEASDEHIASLSGKYTILQLIDLAQDATSDSFTAPAAMIRKSVEGFIRSMPNIAFDARCVYTDKDSVKTMYDRILELGCEKKVAGEITEVLLETGILTTGKPFVKFQPIKRDGKIYYAIGLFMRLLNTKAFKDYDEINNATKFWKICNLFIHDKAIETCSPCVAKSIDLDSWKEQTLSARKDMFTDIYKFFKDHGVPMIGG